MTGCCCKDYGQKYLKVSKSKTHSSVKLFKTDKVEGIGPSKPPAWISLSAEQLELENFQWRDFWDVIGKEEAYNISSCFQLWKMLGNFPVKLLLLILLNKLRIKRERERLLSQSSINNSIIVYSSENCLHFLQSDQIGKGRRQLSCEIVSIKNTAFTEEEYQPHSMLD